MKHNVLALAMLVGAFAAPAAFAQSFPFVLPNVSATVVNQAPTPVPQRSLFRVVEFQNVSPSVNFVTATVQVTSTDVPGGRALGFPLVTVRNAAGFPVNVTVTTVNENQTINLLGTPPNGRVTIFQPIYTQ